jgi:hypothetical protein
MDSSRADRLQGFASCFLSAAVPGGASLVKVEAAGGVGATLTSAAQPYNGSGKHEAYSADSFCCPDSSLAVAANLRRRSFVDAALLRQVSFKPAPLLRQCSLAAAAVVRQNIVEACGERR